MADSRGDTSDQAGPSPVSRRRTGAWRRRLNWALLVLLTYLALESAVIGLALGDAWLVLLAPGFVCGYKAVETWRALMGRPAQRA